MANENKVQSGGIVFGDWKLVPCEGANAESWELCHYHAATRGKSKGTVRWNRCGKYYQWDTVGSALLYAADFELRHGSTGEATDIREALAEYRRIVMEFRQALTECLSASRQSPQ